MGEPRIVYGPTVEIGLDCTVRPGPMGVGPGAVSAGSYAGAREELAALLARPEVARGVAGVLLAQLRVMGVSGAPYPEWAGPLLRGLQDVAQGRAGGSGTGTAPGTVSLVNVAVSEGWLPAREAAAAVGCSEEYVRRLARQRRIHGVRSGRKAWLVDPVSLRSVVYKSGVRVAGGRS